MLILFQQFLQKFYQTLFITFAKISISIFIFFLILVLPAISQQLPKGFNQILVASGISNPTVMAFAPDGRLFVAEQTGALRIIKNGGLLSKPFITLQVNSKGERGLLGIAFDPDFNTNKYIYLYYTLSSAANNRISRFTANGDVVVPGSEVVILNLSPLSNATNHNGGSIQFGKDGKLYVGIGDNANSANAQNLDTYLGKILRINADGTVPDGNPFKTGSEERRRIWSYGLRNPFTLSVQPLTGKIFVNDVGQNMWEEINNCTTGGLNYGWPLAEGKDSTLHYTNPVYTYAHGSGSEVGCAITGGTFFNPSKTNYPSSYVGKYFFLDYCSRWINSISIKNNTVKRENFASSIPGSAVCITTGNDGNLYFLSRTTSAVYKITYTNSDAPVIDEQPVSITVSKGKTAVFYVKASSADSLFYQWRKNGVSIKGATNPSYKISSVTYSDAGTYSVIVSNRAGRDTSSNATLTVTDSNQTPTATIETPKQGATYAGGNKISFSGAGTDPEDGSLPASDFKWFVLFYHDAHTHPGPTIPAGITRGSFTIPDIGETSANVFYRLYLVVTDSKGASDTSFTDILPRKSTITIQTNPENLLVTLDGQPFTAPVTVISVEGMVRTIGVITHQGDYTFSGWNNGGDTIQTFATPVNDVAYTANFSKTTQEILTPVADAFVRAGTFANTNFGSSPVLYSKKSHVAYYEREIYLRFDISSFPPDASSATLRLYGALNSTEDDSVAIDVHNVSDNNWVETTITRNNNPLEDTSTVATTSVAGTTFRYYDWDITKYIKIFKKAGANFVTIKLINRDITVSRVEFNSREAEANRPQLVVNYFSTASKQQNNTQIVLKERPNKELMFSIYPNPAKNIFYVLVKNNFNSDVITLSDINGRLIRNIAITNNKMEQINAGDLKNGVYLLTVRNGKKSITKEIVVEK
ncbi:PQQ-dependent sugar dehydrogenase [Segetibacter koreensis]|uniref:PQQ-dependent sugar dehydrogenase n=1 Tax=Segetibacter koreensis TaxID=398037 RepID=UPI000381267A|nr:PQQ-dependent sugar dehydrogenase [Segetibacter koreensis]